MNNSFKMVSELLRALDGGTHPNIDMLIIKPALYAYIPSDQLEYAKKTGIKADDNNLIKAYFTRIPETVDTYKEFLQTHIAVKVMISKLKSVKDQKVIIKPVNVSGAGDTISEDDIKKIMKKNRFFFNYFTSGKPIDKVPHAVIWVEKGYLPSFTYKIVIPKPQIVD